MANNERSSPPKTSTRKTGQKAGPNANSIHTTQDQSIRDTRYYTPYADEDLLAEDDPYASNPPRSPSSVVRLNKPSPTVNRRSREVSLDPQTRRTGEPPYIRPRRSQTQEPETARPPRNATTSYAVPTPKKDFRNMHWLLYLGLGMILLLALWVIGASALAWGTNEYNTIVYGYPRTFQTDAVVGHNDSPANPSHFMALNLHGQVIIIELPGGDPAKAVDYTGPDLVGPGDDQIPITLSFSDTNHVGKPDMLIHIADRMIVFTNNGTKFVPPNTNTN